MTNRLREIVRYGAVDPARSRLGIRVFSPSATLTQIKLANDLSLPKAGIIAGDGVHAPGWSRARCGAAGGRRSAAAS